MTNDEHWHSHGKAIQRRILGHVMFEIRAHTCSGPPIATRIAMLRRRIDELEAEAASERQASATSTDAQPAEKTPRNARNTSSKGGPHDSGKKAP